MYFFALKTKQKKNVDFTVNDVMIVLVRPTRTLNQHEFDTLESYFIRKYRISEILTEKRAPPANLANPVTGTRTRQSVQLVVNGNHGVPSQTWEQVQVKKKNLESDSGFIRPNGTDQTNSEAEAIVTNGTHRSCSSCVGRRCQRTA